MFIPQYLRLDAGTPTPLTREQIEPTVREAMKLYFDIHKADYGQWLLSADEAAEVSLRDHHIVLINSDYLIGYSKASEWYARGYVLTEEYLLRVGTGSTRLSEVFGAMKTFALLHGARGCEFGTRAASNKAAIRRLYARHGLTETMTVMRC